MYFVIANRLIKCFDFMDIQYVPRLENQKTNELAQIALGYKVSKEKLEDLVEVREKVNSIRLSPSDLTMTKLRSTDPEIFKVLAFENLTNTY